jgi:two-component system, OmpR family, response regulator
VPHTVRIVANPAVLVVDDDLPIQGMVRSVLHREGFAVDIAGSGNDAVALLGQRSYDAIVLDVMMRDGSGHDVLSALAATRPAVKCVVVVSAMAPAQIEELPDDNVQASLRKPFEIMDLVAAVRRCVSPEQAS